MDRNQLLEKMKEIILQNLREIRACKGQLEKIKDQVSQLEDSL